MKQLEPVKYRLRATDASYAPGTDCTVSFSAASPWKAMKRAAQKSGSDLNKDHRA
jgi:hypothetical protein